MSLLKNIIAHKREEVENKKKFYPLKTLRNSDLPGMTNFQSVLEKKGISIIAEIKRMSPSAGFIRRDFNPIQLAKTYEENGARAISVLTDARYFGGSIDDILEVKKTVNVPILRKEFIIDEYQIYESRFMGCDAVLLIAGILTSVQLKRFISIAREIGLACLIEVHKKNEIEEVLTTGAEIIGINNRNLDTLRVDIVTSLKLKRVIPEHYITVSESGIRTRRDVRRLEESGFHALLIGETLMKAEKPGNKLRELSGAE